MEYILGAAAGLAYGGIAGIIKYLILWKKVLNGNKSENIGVSAFYKKMIISNVINVVVVVTVFLVRDMLPVDYVIPLIATAVGLSLSGRLAPMKKIAECTREDKI